jgi:hypothetical protein
MKKFLRFGAASAVVAASLGMSTVANAQTSAIADARAEILTALEMTLDTNSKLDFGTMVVTGAGTVKLDAVSGLDCSTAAIVCSGTTEVAAFSITAGTGGKAVTINFDTPSVKLLRVGGTANLAADELVLNNFNSDAALETDINGDTYYEVTLSSSGTETFGVGGDLSFDGTEVAGVYEGTFAVSVEYS